MERLIVNRLRESRGGVSLGSYKGYSLRLDNDNNVVVYKGNQFVVSCENEDEAQDYIDDMVNKSKPYTNLKYCVKVLFPGDRQWYYLCTDNHYKRENLISKSSIKVFNAKNTAEQALHYSTRYKDCIDRKVEIFR